MLELYCTQKYCLSLEVEALAVEKVMKIHDFAQISHCKLQREFGDFDGFSTARASTSELNQYF